MTTRISKAVLLLGASLILSGSVLAQNEKVKVDGDEYKYKSENGSELKIKQEGDEVKIKGKLAPARVTETVEVTEVRTGETIAPVEKKGSTSLKEEISIVPAPEKLAVKKTTTATKAKKTAYAGKRTYAAKKKCSCKKVAARKKTAVRRTAVAAAPKPVIVRDTVFVVQQPETRIVTEYVYDTVMVTRVDTVFRMQEQSSFAGYRQPRMDFKKMKIKKEDDGIFIKKKLENGDKVKESFETEREYNSYKLKTEY